MHCQDQYYELLDSKCCELVPMIRGEKGFFVLLIQLLLLCMFCLCTGFARAPLFSVSLQTPKFDTISKPLIGSLVSCLEKLQQMISKEICKHTFECAKM